MSLCSIVLYSNVGLLVALLALVVLQLLVRLAVLEVLMDQTIPRVLVKVLGRLLTLCCQDSLSDRMVDLSVVSVLLEYSMLEVSAWMVLSEVLADPVEDLAVCCTGVQVVVPPVALEQVEDVGVNLVL